MIHPFKQTTVYDATPLPQEASRLGKLTAHHSSVSVAIARSGLNYRVVETNLTLTGGDQPSYWRPTYRSALKKYHQLVGRLADRNTQATVVQTQSPPSTSD